MKIITGQRGIKSWQVVGAFQSPSFREGQTGDATDNIKHDKHSSQASCV